MLYHIPPAAESVRVHMQAMHRKEMHSRAHICLKRFITADRHACVHASLAHWAFCTFGTHKTCRQIGLVKQARLWVSRRPPSFMAQSQPLLLHKPCSALVGSWSFSCHPVFCPWSPTWAEIADISCNQEEGSSPRKRGLVSEGTSGCSRHRELKIPQAAKGS